MRLEVLVLVGCFNLWLGNVAYSDEKDQKQPKTITAHLDIQDQSGEYKTLTVGYFHFCVLRGDKVRR
jgi:hypothetical protein